MRLKLLAALLGAALVLPCALAAGESVHACAVLDGLTPPASLARTLAEADPVERRARLVAVRRAEVAGRARAVRVALAGHAAAVPRVLWGPGLVCAEAPPAIWERVHDLPGVSRVFLDPPRAESEIQDASLGGPNEAVAPESPLIALRVPEAWERGFTGRGVVVALIDTGVDMTHADLAHAIWANDDEIAGNGVDDDGNGYVDDVRGWDFASNDNDPSDSAGHGTSAAGLIAGNGAGGSQTGAAPDVTLMVLRRGTTQAALWEASQYAIDNGAKIISQSTSWKWSFQPDYGSWRAQADMELAAGVLHVNSSGNTGLDPAEPVPYAIATPANVPPPWHHPEQSPQTGLSSVLGVGNVDANTLGIVATSPSGPAEWTDIVAHVDPLYPFAMPENYRDYPVWNGQPGLGKPDLVAPGENSLSTARNGGYTVFGGTSAATPRVAGLLALLAQSAPDATPAQLAEALLLTARDIGPPGRDARHGAGLPDTLAAIDALGPPVRLTAWRVVDEGAPRGDGDGHADEGEIVRLAVTIENLGTTPLEGLDLSLAAADNRARVRDGYARLATLPALSSAEIDAPYFGVEFRTGSCAQRAALELTIAHEGGRKVLPLVLPIGEETRTSLIETDFESDAASFTASGTSSQGAWVRAIPTGTTSNGVAANPAADNGGGADVRCFVTGNGPTDPNAADVDGGRADLLAPVQDAASFARVELIYHRFFHGSDAEDQDALRVEARPDATASWTLVEEVPATEASWRRRSIVLSDLVTPSAALALRFSAEDTGADHVVEAGLDDVSLVGVALACEPWTIVPTEPPGALGATLRAFRAPGGHLLLTWESPAAGAPFGYRVLRSSSAQSGFETLGLPATESFVEIGGAAPGPPAAMFYRVTTLEAVP